ncbi:hypothetical protein [Synechococcus sp. HK01-R]|uniref:hypothetical protein n=1 Tax=Synechococcus sp. HK01-R TaxID=2751171 RepID=UPI001629D3FC|nr:hypothetical protein [Synechococcus sp. HK01-R]QNG26144.1 hypothetical protein H0O21_07490 [Synechococcus sp. HK01-R]
MRCSFLSGLASMLLPLLSAAASAAPIPVVPIQFARGSSCGTYAGAAPVELMLQLAGAQDWRIDPRLDPRPDAVPLQVMVIYPGEEADGMAEPAGYRRIRTPRAGLYRYRVLNGDAVDVRFCVF